MDGTSFMAITICMNLRCGREEMALFTVIAYKIWNRCNSILHGGEFSHSSHVVQEVEELLYQYTIAQGKQFQVSHEVRIQEKWQAPSFGRYKVNWDIAIDQNRSVWVLGSLLGIIKVV